MNFISELKRRNVLRVAAAYLVSAWLVIQVTNEVGPALHLPGWVPTMVVWLGIVGFPFMLVFAWVFEMTPQGLVRDDGPDEETDDQPAYSTRSLNMLITALLAMALVFVIVDSYVMPDSETVMSQPAVEPELADQTLDSNSIAVLPFANLSDDDSQVYFSDGLAEELLNLLAKQPGLKVAARTSSFAFRDKGEDIRAIGDALDVATVLEGSVRKSGNKLRITAQLINASDGYHMWSETYDRELDDIFETQDEIAAAIVQALSLHLDMPLAADQQVADLEAYDLYLQGRHMSREASQESSQKALELYRQATSLDPGFAPAWAALGSEVIYLKESTFWEGIPEAEAEAMAQDSIDRALALSPDLAEALVTQSHLHWEQYRMEDALASADRAVAANPNLAAAHGARASVLNSMGYISAAWDALSSAIALDPLDKNPVRLRLRLALFYLDDDHIQLATDALTPFFESGQQEQLQTERAISQFRSVVQRQRNYAELYQSGSADAATNFQAERFLSIVKLWRFDSPFIDEMRYPDMYRMFLTSWRNRPEEALQMYAELPEEIQSLAIVLEERSSAQIASGDCQGALDSLKQAHGGAVRVYGQVPPSSPRSNSTLALNRAWCLRQLGREDEASAILRRVETFVMRLRDSAIYNYYTVDAKLRVLNGDIGGGLSVLEDAWTRNELEFSVFGDPVLRSLAGEARFEALRSELTVHVNAEREKLEWLPVVL